jgi:hypothetical protein
MRAPVGRLLRRGRLRIWIALAVGLGVALGQLPLFGVLGYELALAASLFGAIAGLDLGAALARELQRQHAPGLARARYPGRTLARTALAAAGLAAATVLVIAVICALRGIWVPTCDWGFGLYAYAILPVTTAALAGALGHAIGVAVGVRPAERRWLPHRGTVLAQLPLLVIAGFALHRFYAAPPVFTYNAILGYFPGNLYDEHVQLGAPLWWSRLEQLAWVVAIVAAVASRLDVPRYRITFEARPAGRRLGPLAFAALAATMATTLHLLGGRLGYAIDADDIEHALGGRVETAHFIIHYTKTPELEREIALVAADHELRYAQVVAQLGAAPPGKLRSFYFASREDKARWIGARDVEMAKPWRREIYLEHRGFPHGSLRHEIAHAVASAFGDPWFGVATRRVFGVPLTVSPGLIEGLAVAVDWPAGYDRLTPHEAVRAMQIMGITPTIRELLSLRFLAVSSARSYTTAGSFLRFLLDRYGAAPLRALYGSGGDFVAAYGKTAAVLEAEWQAMIATIQLPPDLVEGSRERFRHGSVFARPCPHAIAAQRDRAHRALAAGNRARAVTLRRAVCADAPEEPRYRLELADVLALGIAVERTEAIAMWTELATDAQLTSSLRFEAIDRLARAAATRGDLADTTALIARARELPVEPNARRQLDAQWFALHHRGPAGPALRAYFFQPSVGLGPLHWAMLAAAVEPELGLGHYLLGLQHLLAGEWRAAAVALDRALAQGVPDLAFVRNGARRLALAAYRAGDHARLGRAIAALHGPGMTETDRLFAEDFTQRLVFDTTGRL